MPQPTADQVQIANEVLAGTRQVSASAPAEDTDAKVAEEEARQKALDASVDSQNAASLESSYGSNTPGVDATPVSAPTPEPEPAPEQKIS